MVAHLLSSLKLGLAKPISAGMRRFLQIPPYTRSKRSSNVPDALLEGMRHLWRKRVTAYGIVHYRSDGFPASIDAQSVRPFADDDALPSSADVLGILPME